MNRDGLRDLFDYTDFTWASYERSLKSLHDDALTRQIEMAGRRTLQLANSLEELSITDEGVIE